MRTIQSAVCCIIIALLQTIAAAAEPEPVNPNATPEARALLRYLYSISGKATLSGQHNFPGQLGSMSDAAHRITGSYPAIWGCDFGFSAEGIEAIGYREANIAAAIEQHRQGAIISFMWHAVSPVYDEPNEWERSVVRRFPSREWKELITPGTPLNQRWVEQVDVIAGYLKQLQDAGVPVLWRPYHEMNGTWYWWSAKPGEDGHAALWRMMYDRYVNYHHLDNLLWVWDATYKTGRQIGPYDACWPGAEYVDILATNIYFGSFGDAFYTDLVELADGKPVALGRDRRHARSGAFRHAAIMGLVHGMGRLYQPPQHTRACAGAL